MRTREECFRTIAQQRSDSAELVAGRIAGLQTLKMQLDAGKLEFLAKADAEKVSPTKWGA